jgi:hypothetical protein
VRRAGLLAAGSTSPATCGAEYHADRRVGHAALAYRAWRSCCQSPQKILLFAMKIGNDPINGVAQA